MIIQTNSPLVSVLIPSYNAQDFIGRCLSSVLAQTYRNIEVIVVDDGSTDDTAAIVHSFAAADTRVRLVRLGVNCGLSCALNRGIDECCGPLIARIDADDYCVPDRLAIQVAFLTDHPEIHIVGSYLTFLDMNGVGLRTGLFPITPEDIRAALQTVSRNFVVAHPAVMYRASVIRELGKYNQELSYAEDYDLWLRAVKYFNIANIPMALTRYTELGGSLTRTNLIRNNVVIYAIYCSNVKGVDFLQGQDFSLPKTSEDIADALRNAVDVVGPTAQVELLYSVIRMGLEDALTWIEMVTGPDFQKNSKSLILAAETAHGSYFRYHPAWMRVKTALANGHGRGLLGLKR